MTRTPRAPGIWVRLTTRVSELVWIACVLLSTTTVWAQAPLVTPQDKDRARERYLAGNEAYRAGDYPTALAAFEEADRIMAVPTTGLGLAKSQQKVGKLLEAFATLERVLRFPQRDDEPESFTEARKEARALLPALAERIPTIAIQVSGVTAGVPVSIAVDGRVLARPDAVEKVNPGKHIITATADGYRSGTAEVSTAEGERRVVSIAMVHELEAPPARDDTAAVALMSTGFGLGLVGILAGTISGVASLGKTADLDEQCGGNTCPEALREEHDRAIGLANASNVSFAVGGAGLLLGVVGVVLFAAHAPSDVVSVSHRGLEVRF